MSYVFLKKPYGIISEENEVQIYNYLTQSIEKTYRFAEKVPKDFLSRVAMYQITDAEKLLSESTDFEKSFIAKLVKENTYVHVVNEITEEISQTETIMYDADKFDKENIYAQYIPTIRFCTVVTAIGYARASAMIGYMETLLKTDFFVSNGIVGSIICATFTFVVAYKLLSKQVKDTQKFAWSIGLIFLGCVASCISPEMALATLGLVLTYTVLDYFGVAICGLFMIYALSIFYYDLNITLIYKSYLLMASGIVFISLFYFIKKLAK